ncbi:MAG: NADH-quinone oxidoreductase subunit NuoE [Betaproteobacteria bacterium]|nr:NADH-quinone oxidoreductase subunit NuoE [Betaproteobacteria bacterium]
MLSDAALQRIDREVAKYPPGQKRSAVMAALVLAQGEKGWLSTEVMDFVAHYLGMPPVAVYEVASFYTMYNRKPVGTYKLTLCTCLPCGLQGSLAAADHLKQRLGIDFDETTPDGMFTLKEGECMGACATAPVVLVNDKRMCDDMTDEKLDALIEELARAYELKG